MKVIYLTLSASRSPTLERDRCRHKYSRTLKDFVDVCLQRDPAKRPTTDTLLRHPLLRSAKKGGFLVERLVSQCPPITARNPAIVMNHVDGAGGGEGVGVDVEEWDFGESATAGDGSSTTTPTTPTTAAAEQSAPQLKRRAADGTVSRRGRFTVTAVDSVDGDMADAAAVVVPGTQPPAPVPVLQQEATTTADPDPIQLALADQPTHATFRKGRFSVECASIGGGSSGSGVSLLTTTTPTTTTTATTTTIDHQQHNPHTTIQMPLRHFEQLSLLVDMMREHLDTAATTQRQRQGPGLGLGHDGHRRSNTAIAAIPRRDGAATEDRRDSLK
jgi:serine/threonine protein kinase